MKKKKPTIIYNEHDYNQVQTMRKKLRQKRRKRRRRLLLAVCFIALIIAFFMSDLSKIKSVSLSGNQILSQDYILEQISVKAKQSSLFTTSSSDIEEEVEKIPFVKSADVSKSFFGDVDITISEANIITYAMIDETLYIEDETGTVFQDEDMSWLEYAKRTPEALHFDLETFKSFAEAYKDVASVVKNQISSIEFVKEDNDPTKCKLVLDDGKILYVRIESMKDQLTSTNYSLVMSKYPDYHYYDFLGNNVYVSQ